MNLKPFGVHFVLKEFLNPKPIREQLLRHVGKAQGVPVELAKSIRFADYAGVGPWDMFKLSLVGLKRSNLTNSFQALNP